MGRGEAASGDPAPGCNLPAGQALPGHQNLGSAPELCCAGPGAPGGLRGVDEGADGPAVCTPYLGHERSLGGIRMVEGTLLGTLLTASPIPSLFIHSCVHSFSHSFIPQTNRFPCPDCPLPQVGRFPDGPQRGQPLSFPSRVCNCSGPRRPRRQRGAVPARLGRTRAPGPSRSGALGPIS